MREEINRQVVPVVLDLAALARHGALAGTADHRRAEAAG